MSGISKQGSRLMRFLLVEAANIAVRFDPDFRKGVLPPLSSGEALHRRQGSCRAQAGDSDVLGSCGLKSHIRRFSPLIESSLKMYSGQRKPDR